MIRDVRGAGLMVGYVVFFVPRAAQLAHPHACFASLVSNSSHSRRLLPLRRSSLEQQPALRNPRNCQARYLKRAESRTSGLGSPKSVWPRACLFSPPRSLTSSDSFLRSTLQRKRWHWLARSSRRVSRRLPTRVRRFVFVSRIDQLYHQCYLPHLD